MQLTYSLPKFCITSTTWLFKIQSKRQKVKMSTEGHVSVEANYLEQFRMLGTSPPCIRTTFVRMDVQPGNTHTFYIYYWFPVLRVSHYATKARCHMKEDVTNRISAGLIMESLQ